MPLAGQSDVGVVGLHLPEICSSAAVAWDPVRHALVLFDGSACSTNDQTWEYAL